MDIDRTVAERRRIYERESLDEATAGSDPFVLFERWLREALDTSDTVEANAMTVATVGSDGRPSARIVLLRGYDRRGFVFFTNYESRKGRELAVHPLAALLFYWGGLERQLRIEGPVERVAADESDAYFATRPRGHRLSAWASHQSERIANRALLEHQMAEAAGRFPDDVPRPPYWGGYRVVPESFEFWQGRPSRVHDRIRYTRHNDAWTSARLSP